MSGFWRRFATILRSFLPFVIAFARDRRRFLLVGGTRHVTQAEHERRAQKLRDTMLDLGPAFVKMGQVLSTRPDIIPPTYATELATLQDTVPEDVGGDPATARADELRQLFDGEPDLEPVAGGSLAYVYETTYKGERVAVKVRRPGVKQQIETDLSVVRKVLPFLTPFVPEDYEFSLRNLADDFESVIFEELDFAREARMMAEIGANFDEDDQVRIPEAYKAASSERILTMEFVEGVRVTEDEALERAGGDAPALANRIAQTYLVMGLEHGIFHADPHPGNLAIDETGRLVIYDFGMSRGIDQAVQQHLIDLYRGLATQHADRLMDALIDLGMLEPTVDRAEVRDVLGLVIETLEGSGAVSWTDIILELIDSLRDFPFRIPPDVMLLLRAGTVSEGVCRSIDPDFDFVAAAREFLIEHGHMESEIQELYDEVAAETRGSSWALLRTPQKLERTLDRVDDEQLVIQATMADDSLLAAARVAGYAFLAGAFAITAALLADPHPDYAMGVGAFAILFVLAFWFGSRR